VNAPRIVACPTCRAPVEWTPASKWRPFCSERCKLIDLGQWATGAYRIPVAEAPDPGEIAEADAADAADGDDPARR
jgi:endogenous inhibitor of DNA gyrase (YacG/DUF329 family)